MTTTTLVAPVALSNDLLTGAEWSPAHARELLRLSADIKARPGRYTSTLHGKFIALIFEKPSLRTRVSFEAGMAKPDGFEVVIGDDEAVAAQAAVDADLHKVGAGRVVGVGQDKLRIPFIERVHLLGTTESDQVLLETNRWVF